MRPDVTQKHDQPPILARLQSKVLLSSDIAGVGKAEDLITVRTGFFLNYIHPRGLGSLATSDAMAAAEEKAAKKAEVAAAEAAEMVELKGKLEAVKTITVSKKAGENGALFGSVTSTEIVEAMEAASGLKLGSPKLTIEDISSVGQYDFTVKLHPVAVAEMVLDVVAGEA